MYVCVYYLTLDLDAHWLSSHFWILWLVVLNQSITLTFAQAEPSSQLVLLISFPFTYPCVNYPSCVRTTRWTSPDRTRSFSVTSYCGTSDYDEWSHPYYINFKLFYTLPHAFSIRPFATVRGFHKDPSHFEFGIGEEIVYYFYVVENSSLHLVIELAGRSGVVDREFQNFGLDLRVGTTVHQKLGRANARN